MIEPTEGVTPEVPGTIGCASGVRRFDGGFEQVEHSRGWPTKAHGLQQSTTTKSHHLLDLWDMQPFPCNLDVAKGDCTITVIKHLHRQLDVDRELRSWARIEPRSLRTTPGNPVYGFSELRNRTCTFERRIQKLAFTSTIACNHGWILWTQDKPSGQDCADFHKIGDLQERIQKLASATMLSSSGTMIRRIWNRKM